jgi:H+/Cl- antiporter ClcA/CBS domain-containing protein
MVNSFAKGKFRSTPKSYNKRDRRRFLPMSVNQPHLFPRKLVDQLVYSTSGITLLLALLIGVATGAGVILFHFLIEHIHDWAFEDLTNLGGHKWLWTISIPMLGGLVVGAMRWYWQDFGLNMSAMLAATQSGEKMKPWLGLVKMFAAAVSLGTGASLGPEGPSVEIGANLGVLMGQTLRVSQERQRLLLAAGAAAGVSAGFNSPIAGVFFALEVVLNSTTSTPTVSVVVLSAVISSLVAQVGLGSQPAFKLPIYEVQSAWELPLYLGLGVLASLLSYTSTQTIAWCRQVFQGKVPYFTWMTILPPWSTPILGGLCVGLTALKFPQITGIGYETIEAMLQDVGFSLSLLALLVVVKLIMTGISLGSGLVGGLFAPSMFLGACLGTAYVKGLVLLVPQLDSVMAAPPAYAMVGMATMLASNARAPLTAILLMFELTRDYRIVLPLMACVGLSIWLVDRLQSSGQPTSGLEKMGLNIQQDEQDLMLHKLLVREAMQVEYLSLAADLNIFEAVAVLVDRRYRSALVQDEVGRLVGIVTLDDVNRSIANDPATDRQVLSSICTAPIIYAHADEPVAHAIERMGGRGLHQLPVIELEQPTKIIGVLCQEHIPLACSLAIAKGHLAQHRAAAGGN